MTADIARLDVPLPELEHNVVVASLDAFARMACEHPEACACDADYPAWAAQLATQSTYRHAKKEAK